MPEPGTMPIIDYTLPFLAYCLGSISSSVLVCRLMNLPDPRTQGSGNPGASNVLRIGGKKAALLTLIGDVLKGLAPVVLAAMISDNPVVIALVGLAAFLGHLYPFFFGFSGGKGVATAAGVYAGLSPQLILALLGVWLLMAMLTRYSSLSALTAAALSPVLAYLLASNPAYIVLCTAIALLTFWRHRGNIARLLDGTESRITLNK